MNKINLDGEWNLYLCQGNLDISNPEELQKSDLVPIKSYVPGNVELDLIKNG